MTGFPGSLGIEVAPTTCRRACLLKKPSQADPKIRGVLICPASTPCVLRFATRFRAWLEKTSHTAVPAKAGTHFSASRVADRWTPAFAGDAVERVSKGTRC